LNKVKSFTQSIHNNHVIFIKAAIIIFAVALVYNQDINLLINEATADAQTSYILLVPILTAYLIYRKRKILTAVTALPSQTKNEVTGIALSALALTIYLAGSYTFHPLEYHILSLPIFLFGCALFLFNIETLKALAFPLAFLFLLIPPPFQTLYTIGGTLANYSAEITFNILKSFGIPATLTTNEGIPAIIIQKANTNLTFSVDVACSGIYSLLAFIVFSSFTAYILRGSIPKRIIVFLAGFPLIYALNILRILVLILLGFNFGIQLSTELFHTYGGWILIFLGTLIILWGSEKLLKLRIHALDLQPCTHSKSQKKVFCETCGRFLGNISAKISRRDVSKTIPVLLLASLIIFLPLPVFALLKCPAEVILSSPIEGNKATQILPQITNYTLMFLYRDETIESATRQDANLVYAYFPNNTSNRPVDAYVEIADTKKKLHSWDKCFAASRTISLYDIKEFQLLEDPPIVAQSFAFQEKGSLAINVVVYWYEKSLFIVNSTVEEKFVKISLMSVVDDLSDRPKMEEEQLLPIAGEIVRYWQPVKQWSQIVLTFAKYRNELFAVMLISVVALISFRIVRSYLDKKSLHHVYSKITSETDKQILKAASQTKIPTAELIASTYHKISGKNVGLGELTEKLMQAEKAGLIKKEMLNFEDSPLLVWRTAISIRNNTTKKVECI
jgi:exosortase